MGGSCPALACSLACSLALSVDTWPADGRSLAGWQAGQPPITNIVIYPAGHCCSSGLRPPVRHENHKCLRQVVCAPAGLVASCSRSARCIIIIASKSSAGAGKLYARAIISLAIANFDDSEKSCRRPRRLALSLSGQLTLMVGCGFGCGCLRGFSLCRAGVAVRWACPAVERRRRRRRRAHSAAHCAGRPARRVDHGRLGGPARPSAGACGNQQHWAN